jgi:predicted Zn-ribbon and HTH transcriptional regulator
MQALDVIPLLKSTMPLERAQMRICAVLSGKDARKLRDKVAKLATSVESEDWDGGQLNLVCMQCNSIGYQASQKESSSSSWILVFWR